MWPTSSNRLQASVTETSRLLAKRDTWSTVIQRILALIKKYKSTVYFSVHYHGCRGATCREMMSLQPAPRAQITSWPTGSVALLKHNKCKYNLCLCYIHVTLQSTVHSLGCIKVMSPGSNICMTQWTGRHGTWVRWCTCRSQPAELGSNSWPARGSDQSAGWGSVKSSVSAGYFLWPLTTPPDLPPDSHLEGKITEGQQKTDRPE